MTVRFTILQTIGLGLIAAGCIKGWVQTAFAGDGSYLTAVIAAGALWGLWRAARGQWDDVRWARRQLVMLGLIGTVAGFIVALSGVDPATVGDVSRIGPMVASLIAGMHIALYTTLVGSICALWLAFTEKVVK